MNRAGPFRPRTVLTLLVIGAAAFLVLLYAIGAGLDGRDGRDGGAHAASNGLTGFSALAELLERRGYEVSLSRDQAALQQEALLVLTPQHFADGEEISDLLAQRSYTGPTLLILPKWYSAPIPPAARAQTGAEAGWVTIGDAHQAGWIDQLQGLDDFNPVIGNTKGWRGFGLVGSLPEPDKVQASKRGKGSRLQPLVRDSEGDLLAAYWDDGGYYPILADAAGVAPPDPDGPDIDDSRWPVVILIEPDLANNYGMADQRRARLAVALVEATLEEYDLPVVFDLTVPGLGSTENLLTLAFRPPFLAATLCLLLAALVIAWRGLRRFGPPVSAAPALALGKGQLARNAAALVERARRLHLLGPPYGALVAARIARALGIRDTDPAAREAAIARRIAARGHDDIDFPASAEALRQARRPGELLRAAGALRTIERKLTQ